LIEASLNAKLPEMLQPKVAAVDPLAQSPSQKGSLQKIATLGKSVLVGSLEEISQEPLSSTELELAKQQAAEALKAVSQDAQALTTLRTQQESSTEQMKAKVRSLLADSHQQGILEAALKRVTTASAESDARVQQVAKGQASQISQSELRGRVRQMLEEASENGSLDAVLDNMPK
jgi:Ulp1 family protease